MRIVAFVVALFAQIAVAQAAGDVAVRDAWARATAGQSKIGAAYLIIDNPGGTADRLVAATSPVAGTVELHTTIQDGDVMRMQKLDSVELGPGAEVAFKPTGMHIMLVGLSAPLKQGTSFPLTLSFASGASKVVDVPVLGPGASGPAAPSHTH